MRRSCRDAARSYLGRPRAGQAKSAVVLLEAMEAAADAPTPSPRLGDPPGRGAYGYTQPQGVLAHERQQHSATGLTNRRLHEQGVPDMRTQWIVLHYGPKARICLEPPYADPHVRWCGTRGWLINSVSHGEPIGGPP
jgi:hypothetical protein